jgi:hypothetical protein
MVKKMFSGLFDKDRGGFDRNYLLKWFRFNYFGHKKAF